MTPPHTSSVLLPHITQREGEPATQSNSKYVAGSNVKNAAERKAKLKAARLSTILKQHVFGSARDSCHLNPADAESRAHISQPNITWQKDLRLPMIRKPPSISISEFDEKLLTPEYLKETFGDYSVESYGESESLEPPDGGYAWVIAFCSMLAVFCTWGTSACFGVFLDFYLTANAFEGATETDYAFIGGLTVFLGQILAPFVVVLYDVFGYKAVCYTGVAIQTLGFILASFATRLWQLYLTQAVLVGVSFSMIFLPTTLVLPTWFKKRLATAMGISVSGSGIGGVVLTLAVSKMIRVTGDQRWALRMCGIVNFAVCIVAVSIVHPYRVKRRAYSETCTRPFVWKSIKRVLLPSFLKNPVLVVTSLWMGVVLLGYVMVLFSVPSVGVLVGLSRTQGANLLVVLNAAQIVGRPLIGLVGDSCGRTNVAAAFCIVLSTVVWGLWMHVTSYGALMVVLALLGLTVGVGSSLGQLIASTILDTKPDELDSAWSWFNIVISFFEMSLEVIAMAMRDPHAKRPYMYPQVFGGSSFFVGFILILGVREYIVRRNFSRLLNTTTQELTELRYEWSKAPEFEARDINVEALDLQVKRHQRFLQKRYYFVRMFHPSIV